MQQEFKSHEYYASIFFKIEAANRLKRENIIEKK
jgi:hypothetical protein